MSWWHVTQCTTRAHTSSAHMPIMLLLLYTRTRTVCDPSSSISKFWKVSQQKKTVAN